MDNNISIQNLSFPQVFDKLNTEIKTNRWLTIIGSNGSGKSVLAKCIAGINNYEGIIKYGNINNDKIGIVFSSSDLSFILNTVDEELMLPKKNLKIDKETLLKNKEKIVSLFNLKKILNVKPTELSTSYKALVSLASVIIYEPQILILDGTLDVLDGIQKEKAIKTLKSLLKKGTTIINITHNIEDTLLGDDVMLIDDGNIILYEEKENFFKNEKVLKKYNVNMPFVVSLSIKLRYYDMVDKLYFNMEELVDAIWK